MKKLMAANWKMYKTIDEARTTARELVTALAGKLPDDREALLLPPFTAIGPVGEALFGSSGISVGGQDFYPAAEGAFTGEISPKMLLNLGCVYGLTGHSERRHVLGESDEFVGRKTAFGLETGLSVILCVGETIEQREAGQLAAVLERQLAAGLAEAPSNVAATRLAVAYEPVWAIGTGKVALPPDIVEAHTLVRRWLTTRFPETGNEIRILYGGSVKPDNAGEILGLDNVDGVLVGGASLRADSFSRIVTA